MLINCVLIETSSYYNSRLYSQTGQMCRLLKDVMNTKIMSAGPYNFERMLISVADPEGVQGVCSKPLPAPRF